MPLGSVIEYICMMAFNKFCSRSRGEAIRKRLLNKQFFMDVSDKENMERFERCLLGPVEKNELEGYIEDLRKRGIICDGPDGMYISAPETMNELSEEEEQAHAAREAEIILTDAALRAAISSRMGISNKIQRTSPGKLRKYYETQSDTLSELPLHHGKQDVVKQQMNECRKEKVLTGNGANDQNQGAMDEVVAKRARYN